MQFIGAVVCTFAGAFFLYCGLAAVVGDLWFHASIGLSLLVAGASCVGIGRDRDSCDRMAWLGLLMSVVFGVAWVVADNWNARSSLGLVDKAAMAKGDWIHSGDRIMKNKAGSQVSVAGFFAGVLLCLRGYVGKLNARLAAVEQRDAANGPPDMFQ